MDPMGTGCLIGILMSWFSEINPHIYNWFGSRVFIAHLSLEVQGPFKKQVFTKDYAF